MFCGQCGKQNPDNTHFCYQCGAPLFHSQAQNAAITSQQPPSVPGSAQPTVSFYQPASSNNAYYYAQTSSPAHNPTATKPTEDEYQTRKQAMLADIQTKYKNRLGSLLSSPLVLIIALIMSYVCIAHNLSQVDDLLDAFPYVEGFETMCLFVSALFQVCASVLYCVGLWMTYISSLDKESLCTNATLITGLRCIRLGAYVMIGSCILSLLGILFPMLKIMSVIGSLFKYFLVLVVCMVILISVRACLGGVMNNLISNLPCASPDAEPAKPLITLSGILAAFYILLTIDAKPFLGPFSPALAENNEALFLNAGLFTLIGIIAFIYYKVSSDLEAETSEMYRQLGNIRSQTTQTESYSSYSSAQKIPAWKLAEMQQDQQNLK